MQKKRKKKKNTFKNDYIESINSDEGLLINLTLCLDFVGRAHCNNDGTGSHSR